MDERSKHQSLIYISKHQSPLYRPKHQSLFTDPNVGPCLHTQTFSHPNISPCLHTQFQTSVTISRPKYQSPVYRPKQSIVYTPRQQSVVAQMQTAVCGCPDSDASVRVAGLQAAQSFLTNLLGGYHLYTDSKGNVITTSNIVAFLDMTPEDTAWRIAPILASLNIPQIRVAPTSSMLLHNPRYPNLISAVPSQTTVHLALLQMLSRLNWKYVQVKSVSPCLWSGCSVSVWLSPVHCVAEYDRLCLSVFPCFCDCVCATVFLSVWLSPSVRLYFCLSGCLCVYFFVCVVVSICGTVFLSVWLSVCVFLCVVVSICETVFLSVWLYVCVFLCVVVSICGTVFLSSVVLSVCVTVVLCVVVCVAVSLSRWLCQSV